MRSVPPVRGGGVGNRPVTPPLPTRGGRSAAPPARPMAPSRPFSKGGSVDGCARKGHTKGRTR